MKKLVFLSVALALLGASTSLADVVFDFNEGTDFDANAGAAVSMTATDGTDTVVMTSVDVLAPEFDALFAPTGNTLSALGGDGVGTNIFS